jgi:hypothetical protein
MVKRTKSNASSPSTTVSSIYKATIISLIVFCVAYTLYLLVERLSDIPYPVSQFVTNYELIEEIITLSDHPKPTSDDNWPKIDVVFPIVTRDAGLLIWFLKSLELFWPYYNYVILLVERKDLFSVRAMLPLNQGRYKIAIVNNPYAYAEKTYNKNFGYLTQQWYKFHVDKFSDAEYRYVVSSFVYILAQLWNQIL